MTSDSECVVLNTSWNQHNKAFAPQHPLAVALSTFQWAGAGWNKAWAATSWAGHWWYKVAGCLQLHEILLGALHPHSPLYSLEILWVMAILSILSCWSRCILPYTPTPVKANILARQWGLTLRSKPVYVQAVEALGLCCRPCWEKQLLKLNRAT